MHRSAASAGVAASRRISSMTSAPTKSDSPSEHSRKRSPILASRSDVSGSSSGWPVMTRVTTERCGWLAGLLLGDAALVDELLHEGVVLRDLAEGVAPEHEGARVADVGHRELVAGAQHDDRRRCPCRRGRSSRASPWSAWRWRCAAPPRAGRSPGRRVTSSASSGASSPTIIELATSPAACPPMPSASTSRLGPAYPESSLRDLGPRPRSERAA